MSAELEIGEPTADDAVGVYAAVRSAFNRPDEADLIVALAHEGAVALALVAKVDGLVLGACVFSRIRLESDEGARPAVALAPLAVAPPFQGYGLGARLVTEGVARLKAAGEQLVHVVGDPGYYARFGFTAETAAAIETPWGGGPAFQAIAFDGVAPGKCRAVYPKAFAALS